jgi:hypothetical protein
MDAMVVGIDVSKDRLDVAVRPTGESFVFKRTAAGIEDLVVLLKARSPGSDLARLPRALAKARTCAGLTTTTGRPAPARPAATTAQG